MHVHLLLSFHNNVFTLRSQICALGIIWEEACCKVGGEDKLKVALAEGRVKHGQDNGISLYFFPKSRSVFRQGHVVKSEMTKGGGSDTKVL